MKKKNNLGERRDLYRDMEWSVRDRIFHGKLVRKSGDVCKGDKMERNGLVERLGTNRNLMYRDVGTFEFESGSGISREEREALCTKYLPR